MKDTGEGRSGKSPLVFIPISVLLLLSVTVGPINPNGRGSYDEAWPNLAAIWMTLAVLLAALWVLMRRSISLFFEGRLFGVAMFAWSAAAIILGTVGLYLAGNVTGFPSGIQHMMLWFSITSGIFLCGVVALVGDSMRRNLWATFAYAHSMALGIVTVAVAIGLSLMLLLIPFGYAT